MCTHRLHTHAHTLTDTAQPHTDTHPLIQTHTHSCTHRDTDTSTLTHTHTRTLMQTRRHTQTHTMTALGMTEWE